MRVPPLETERLIVRPFAARDLDDVHQILDVQLATADLGSGGPQGLNERRRWLEWTILGYDQFAILYQPPYGDRAVILKESQQMIGACGYVPCLNAFEQLPSLGTGAPRGPVSHATPEFGLFYAISPPHQRRGYATEAARAMIDYAFSRLRLKRIVATTTHDNIASIAVMRRVGMRIEANPYSEPPWLQVVGILEISGQHRVRG